MPPRTPSLNGPGVDRAPAQQVFSKASTASKKLMALSLSSLREEKRQAFKANLSSSASSPSTPSVS